MDNENKLTAYWILIPPQIAEDENLSLSEKVLAGKIVGLTQKDGYCYASNAYLAHYLNTSIATIKRYIKKLKDSGFIRVEVERNDSKQVTERRIYTLGSPVSLPRFKSEPTPRFKNEPVSNKKNSNKIKNHNLATSLVAGVDVNSLIPLFEEINPSWKLLFSNKTQRAALERLAKEHGESKLKTMLERLPAIVSRPYAPRVTTPLQLEQKMGELMLFARQAQTTKGGVLDARTR